jgi:hypothetical protein
MDNSNLIDLSFFAAKLATLNNEKAKLVVDGASAIYNVTQVLRLRSIISQYDQIAGYLLTVSQYRGYCMPEEYNMFMLCKQQIKECNDQLVKYGVMTVIDSVSVMLDLLNGLNKR